MGALLAMSHQQRIQERLLRIAKRFMAQIEKRGDSDAPGVLMHNDRVWIDNGSYGDPHKDSTPDFAKDEDEAAWTVL